MNCKIETISKEKIHIIKHLWERLNIIHMIDSTHFKEYYRNNSFEERCRKFSLLNNKEVFLEILKDENVIVGYCISSIKNSIGELDSLYIEKEYRKYGFGQKLTQNSIIWLKENQCKKILVSVAEGHESVFGSYEKNGFYPRLTYLELKK